MKKDLRLAFPCYGEEATPLELWVDALSVGAGACLRQLQKSDYVTIGYASMTFNRSEQNYSTIDRGGVLRHFDLFYMG